MLRERDFPKTGTAPVERLNTLANLLNACIVASNTCAPLYSATSNSATAPSNTLDAILNLAKNPASNVTAIYAASRASSAYSPTLASAPSDWDDVCHLCRRWH